MISAQGLRVLVRADGDKVAILRHVSFEVPGRALAVIGPNGSGKTTLLRVIAGVIAADQGRMWVDGRPQAAAGGAQGSAYVPQHAGDGLWLDLTVRESLLLSASRGRLAWPGFRDWARCASELRWFPSLLADRLDVRVSNLSGGERQVLMLATALAGLRDPADTEDPLVIVADEFTSALDPKNTVIARGALRSALSASGPKCIFVFATHSFAEMREFASDVVVLTDGGVVSVRRAADVSVDQFQQAYDLGQGAE